MDRDVQATTISARGTGVTRAVYRTDNAETLPGSIDGTLRVDEDLNPPQSMRLASKGIDFGSILARRGSFMTFALTRSRCARDLYPIQEKATVSPRLSLILRGNGTKPFMFRSSPTHSRNSSAPVLAPDPAGLPSKTPVGLQVPLRDRQNETIDVPHESSFVCYSGCACNYMLRERIPPVVRSGSRD